MFSSISFVSIQFHVCLYFIVKVEQNEHRSLTAAMFVKNPHYRNDVISFERVLRATEKNLLLIV